MSYAQLQGPDFIRTVIPHLRNGIENFRALADILLEYDESKNQAIQQVIRKGKASLDQADAAASAELSKVNEYTERLTSQKGQLSYQQTNKRKDLENLKSESQYIADCLESNRGALDTAQWSLNSARDTLDELESKQRESEIVRDVGIGIMFIPIIGTIAGAIMVAVSEEELEHAQWAASEAWQEVENCERAVSNYSSRLEEMKRRRKEKKEEMEECCRAIRQIERSLAQVSEQRNGMLRVQEKIRIAVNALGTLAGRAAVAKTLTERVVCLSPIVNVLGEIVKLTIQLYENRKCEIFRDPQVRAAIQSLQDIYKKVSAIDGQNTLEELQFY
ncbi:uncharacterized protein LOC118232640 isoform X1 [Anguilla anguilla]|uniref:uncharacterized protein LOC118232640 isoform X1 n=1 Tax=Anguilla anguilla TaxID=7936 RepID=UPI0015AD1F0C|nr:uncharacterized protein LOC118232640 isoform X1 [Anguilla anguilla]XP_035283616.1 uncharacterized protein LOC118232640 isoform X1 [Anguilla anguilla]